MAFMPTVRPRRTANGSRCLRPPRRSELRTAAFAASLKPASSLPSRLCRALPTQSAPTSCNRIGWPPRLGEQVVRVALCRETNSQCFQILEEEGHNERRIAIGRRAWLFAGSDRGGERAAAMFTLIETAKL